MQLVDLSREIYHKMPRIVTHPPIIITPFGTHEEIREADGYKFSSATLSLAMGDHAGTHVDAPAHFDARPGAKGIDEMPLENFFTEAVCLDLAHKPLKSDISIEDLREGGAGRGHRHQAQGHRAPAHGLLSPLLWHRRLSHGLSGPDQGVAPPGSARRASPCSASRP